MSTEKIFDLEKRSFIVAKDTNIWIKALPKTLSNIEYAKQLIRSSSSVGANYIEANESLGKKDFQMHIKICVKEAKESVYWLKLIIETNKLENTKEGERIINEFQELKKIFSTILNK